VLFECSRLKVNCVCRVVALRCWHTGITGRVRPRLWCGLTNGKLLVYDVDTWAQETCSFCAGDSVVCCYIHVPHCSHLRSNLDIIYTIVCAVLGLSLMFFVILFTCNSIGNLGSSFGIIYYDITHSMKRLTPYLGIV